MAAAARFSLDSPVFAAESDLPSRAALRRCLREFQFRNVTFAEHALGALQLGKSKQFSLILLSTSLEGGDAFRVFFNLRAEGRNIDSPIVLLYGAGEEDLARRAGIMGASGVLRKPVTEEALRELLEKVLGAPIITETEERMVARKLREDTAASHEPPLPARARAKELLEEGKPGEAEAALHQALAEEAAASEELLSDVAEARLARGDVAGAEEMLAEAARFDPDAPERFRRREPSFVRRGNRRLGESRFESARDEFGGAVHLNRESVAGHFGISESLGGLGDGRGSLEAFEHALNIDRRPEDLHVYNRMGIAARREKDYSRALRAYDRALSFNPDDPVLHYNKAMVFVAQRLYRSALVILKKALALDPDFGEAREARRILLETVTAPLRRGRRVVSLSQETQVVEDVPEDEI